MNLVEGESTNALVNLDRLELAIIQQSDGADNVVAVPGSRLIAAAKSKATISDDKDNRCPIRRNKLI